MGKIVVTNHVSLDGVMQSPAGADEDTRGGFEHGGWAIPGNDEVMGREMGKGMAKGGPLLLGRRTYEHFFSYWPHQHGNPIKDVLDNAHKYVVSSTLTEPLPWQNSTLVSGDVPEEVARIKQAEEKDIGVLGSGDLLQTLMAQDLVDTYVLLIHPLVLGAGRRLFRDGGTFAKLTLADSVTTTTGVTIATYERAR
jgi:dihydrofolate reductase